MSQPVFVSYPENKPTDRGYYYTLYYNFDLDEELYKCIYWNGEYWVSWRPNGGPPMKILKFVPSSREEYYTNCLRRMIEEFKT